MKKLSSNSDSWAVIGTINDLIDKVMALDKVITRDIVRIATDEIIEEHIALPIPGGTATKCSCGKIFVTSQEYGQHRQWNLDLAIKAKQLEVIERVEKEVNTNQKGQFEDNAGNVCWYLDSLNKALDTLRGEIDG